MTPTVTRLSATALFAASVLGGLWSGPAFAADPFGIWLTEDGRARVRTERCGSDAARLCGFVVWGSTPLDETGKPRTDKHNPDPARRSRRLLGHQLLLGLKPSGEGRYEGQIYNGDNGKSYDVTVWSEKPSELSVKGCILVFCGTQTWTRVGDVAPGQLQGATDAENGPRSDPEWAAKPGAPGGKKAQGAQPR